MARSSGMQGKTKDGVLRLYRNVQKEVPWLLSIYGIDADPVEVRGKIAQVFRRHGTGEIEPRVAKMLVTPACLPRCENVPLRAPSAVPA